MTGVSPRSSGRASESEVFLSPVMDRRTEPKFMNEPLAELGGRFPVTGVGNRPGPKGRRLRSARKAGIPEPDMFPDVVMEVEAGATPERIDVLSAGGGLRFGGRGETTGMLDTRGGC
jgi:hypothetical protein